MASKKKYSIDCRAFKGLSINKKSNSFIKDVFSRSFEAVMGKPIGKGDLVSIRRHGGELSYDDTHNIINVEKLDDDITWDDISNSIRAEGGLLIGPFGGDRIRKEP